MTQPGYDEHTQILNKLVSLCKEKQPKAKAELLEPFIRQYYARVSLEDLKARELIDLYGAVLSHWRFMYEKKPGEAKVRVYNPQFELHGWQTTHTAIEVCHDDMPFLVDSIRMELTRKEHNIHLTVHLGGMRVERDENSKITKILDPQDVSHKFCPEAPIYVEIDRQTDEKYLKELEKRIKEILCDVKHAVQDWQKMTARISEHVDDLRSCLDPKEDSNSQLQEIFPDSNLAIDEKELKETIQFLEWMRRNNFTFLGSAYYKLVGEQGNEVWEPVKGYGLGILYDNKKLAKPRSLKDYPSDARNYILSPHLLSVQKTRILSAVHRPAYLHAISRKILNKNNKVIGECRFLGLFTATAYNSSPMQIPFIHHKVNQVLSHSGFPKGSHDGKALLNILETLPRDILFEAVEDEIYQISIGIFHLQERQRIRLFIRRDIFGRYYTCLVFVPRDRFNSDLREKMQDILMEELEGAESTFSTRFSESVLARIHFEIRIDTKKAKEIDVNRIEKRLAETGRVWKDDFREALFDYFGEAKGNKSYNKYVKAFPISYIDDFPIARSAVYDIEHLEKLKDKDSLGMSFYRSTQGAGQCLRFKLFRRCQLVPLSDVVPMLENMGVRVISERPYHIQLADDNLLSINDYTLEYEKGMEFSVDAVKNEFQETFGRVWKGHAENDGFNRLVLAANLNWREISLLRAYSKYIWQTGFTFSQTYIEDTLFKHADIAKTLVKLFNAQFDPKSNGDREIIINEILKNIEKSFEDVEFIDEDKILRRYLDIIKATVRTNFFQLKNKQFKLYISLKFDPSKIPDLPLPLPCHEVFVYSARMEGVHLRGADVARGGLRWSDRIQDFRTEVLGLMKAQQVKNAVIVPMGAKGGFVSKTLPDTQNRDEIMAEVVHAYQTFIRGLLDITDNLEGEKLIAPKDIVRLDKDDPYLVVAADKGTATFSDTANEISENYGFWLKDAFASGGSTGYDHKKMGITARGAWESVKRHFREMGINTQTTDFTVVGIGDMAGDVFGNGMLLSPHIKLIAAYNHQHIFIDPTPSAEESYKERKRLFQLPRSGWSDYNPKLISKGGGVFERRAKSILVTPEIQKALGITASRTQPNELIQAILKAEVDLLWNGGIGTFVKAVDERHIDVGDKFNDLIRINGNDLRAKVVGEGGNLGLTQLGRIDYALNGGRLYTDALDNSAGVDCSDHEVNIKILLNEIVKHGDLTEKQRNQLLMEMTDEVADLVLKNNKQQVESVSLAFTQSLDRAEMHVRLMKELESVGRLDRNLEFLPSTEQLRERAATGNGLTQPEISVLMGYIKTWLKQSLLESDIPEDPYISKILSTAFPKVLEKKFPKQMQKHQLRREIICTQLANEIINDMGINFVHRLKDETGAPADKIVRSYAIVKDVFDVTGVRSSISHLDLKVPSEIQIKMIIEFNRLIRRATRWFLRNHDLCGNIPDAVNYYTPRILQVSTSLPNYLAGTQRQVMDELLKLFTESNVPTELASRIASMGPMFSALDIVAAASTGDFPVDQVAHTYFVIGDKLNLGWFREQIKSHTINNHWDAMARAAFRDDLDKQQRQITCSILNYDIANDDMNKRIENWLSFKIDFVNRWEHLVNELKASNKQDFLMYAIALRELTDLTRTSNEKTEDNSESSYISEFKDLGLDKVNNK